MATNPKAQTAANKSEQKEVTLEDLLKDHNMTAEEEQPVEQIDTEAEDVKQVERQYDLSNNPFMETIFNPDMTNEEKKAALVELLAFDDQATDADGNEIDSIEANRVRQKQFEEFKAEMQRQRKKMAQDILHLTDRDTYAELAKMYKQIASEMSSYEKQLQPLLDIISAVDLVRQQGKLVEVYDSFGTDKEGMAKYENDLAQARALREKDAARLEEVKLAIGQANEDTTPRFLGMGGGIRKRSRMKLVELQQELEKLEPRLAQENALIAKMEANPFIESLPELKEAKKIVKDLVELGTEQHRQRIQDLIDTADNFINTTDVRGHAVLDSYLQRREHINNLSEGNSGLNDVYALISDATKVAKERDDVTLKKYEKAPELPEGQEEDAMDRIVRERMRDAVLKHVTNEKRSQKDTEQVRSELETQKLALVTTGDNNETHILDARALVGSVNAQVAEGLATALDSVTGAATDLARLVAEDINQRMKKKNFEVIAGEVTRMSQNSEQSADKLKKSAELMGKLLKLTEDTANKARTGEANADAAMTALDDVRKKLAGQVTDLLSAPANSGKSAEFNKNAPRTPANDTAPADPATDLARNPLRRGLGSKAKKPTAG